MLWEDKNIWMITLAKFWLFADSTGSSQPFHFWLILSTADQPAGRVQVRQLLHPKNLFGFRLQALRHRSTADKVHVTA